jgi:PadR family transcriptional regulator PadR
VGALVLDGFSTWMAQFRKGLVELLILQLLLDGEKYGYLVVQELKGLGDMAAGEATVYPVLRRLEASGYVVARWVHEDSGNPRKYYAITDGGRGFLARALDEWDKTESVVRSLRGRA